MAVEILENSDFAYLASQLPLSGNQKGTLATGMERRRIIQSSIQELTESYACAFEKYAAPLTDAEGQVNKAKQAVDANNNFWAVLGRVRRNIFTHPDYRPPWYSKIFTKIMPPIHKPHPLTEALTQAQEALDRSRKNFFSSTQQLEHRILPIIDENYKRMEAVDNNLLSICRGIAITSDSNLEVFVSVAPWQAQQTASAYAESKVIDTTTLTKFQQFVDFIYANFKKDKEIPTYNVKPETYGELHPITKRCWLVFVEYKKLLDLSQKGLISQPQIPASLRRLGPDLDL